MHAASPLERLLAALFSAVASTFCCATLSSWGPFVPVAD